MLAEMREIDLDFFFERAPLVARHADRLGDRALLRKAALARRESHPRPQQIDHVLHVGAIENREVGLEAHRRAHPAQHVVGERMEGAARDCARAISDELLCPPQHLLRGAPRERQQQDRAGRHAALDQPRDAIDQRASLARSRARHDQQRAVAMRHGGELRGIQQLGVLDFEVALIGRRGRLFAQVNYLVGHVKRDPTTPRAASYDPRRAYGSIGPLPRRRLPPVPVNPLHRLVPQFDWECWTVAGLARALGTNRAPRARISSMCGSSMI